MSRVLIACNGVLKQYGGTEVLCGINVAFREGQVSVIVGASGSGKSTLLRTLNRLESHDGGFVTVDGVPPGDTPGHLRRLRQTVGMVFQQFNLFPHLSVLDNITLAPRRVQGHGRAEAETDALALLARVGLRDHAGKYPHQLSGGQQQRVAIARALATRPKALLFDEPTSALDPAMVKEVLDVIRQLARDGMTMIIVTHEMAFAREVADRILLLDGGRIVCDATPARFFGDMADAPARAFLGRALAAG